MVNAPLVRMGPLPRSLAAEANECFTVRVHKNPTEYKYAAQDMARNGRLPSVRIALMRQPALPGQTLGATLKPLTADQHQRATVLTPGKVRCSPSSPCSREERCAWLRAAPLLPSPPLRAAAFALPGRDGKAGSQSNRKAGTGQKGLDRKSPIQVPANTDKAPTYAAALAELKSEGKCPKETLHRQVNYLNNIIEADHGKLKQLSRPVRGFKTLKTAYATIKGFEVMRALRKGQASAFNSTNDIGGDARIVERAFGLGLSAVAEVVQIFNKRLELKTV